MSTIQADFDLLAEFPEQEWDHNIHYHNFLLQHVPATSRQSLEIGCGTGAFSRSLATRSERVLALDLSPNMIRMAERQSFSQPNVDFRIADVMHHELGTKQFDCIVSIATLHHVPMDAALLKMKRALKVNGVLMILDLFQEEGWRDAFRSAVALPVSMLLRLIKGNWILAPRSVRDAWAKHGRSDTYLTMDQVRNICDRLLPGAEVKTHLFWRYSIVWKKVSPAPRI